MTDNHVYEKQLLSFKYTLGNKTSQVNELRDFCPSK